MGCTDLFCVEFVKFGEGLTANTEPSISNLEICDSVGFDKACVETMGDPRKG